MTTFKFKTKKAFKILTGSDQNILEGQANATIEHWQGDGWDLHDVRISNSTNTIILVLIFSKDEFEEQEKQD